jgi:putative flippase GtrA
MEIINLLKSNLKKHENFIKYITIGLVGLVVDMGIFALLVHVFNVNELIANPIGMVAGIVNNFLMNAFFNFKKTDKLFRRFTAFFTIGIFGIFFSEGFIFLIHRVLFLQLLGHSMLSNQGENFFKIELLITKGVSIVLVALIQFFLNRKISFRKYIK